MTSTFSLDGARLFALTRSILAAMRDGLARVLITPDDAWTVQQMRGMPDYLLRDVGLHRSEIEGVVRGMEPRVAGRCR